MDRGADSHWGDRLYSSFMSRTEGVKAPAEDPAPGQLGRLFALIVFVEILTIGALYAFSRHFAQP
jgi:hypothetical protein